MVPYHHVGRALEPLESLGSTCLELFACLAGRILSLRSYPSHPRATDISDAGRRNVMSGSISTGYVFMDRKAVNRSLRADPEILGSESLAAMLPPVLG